MDEKLNFRLNDDGASYTVFALNGQISGEVVIPAVYNGKPVTKIRGNGFSYHGRITSVIIPESITEIEYCAFRDCGGIKGTIIIPESVEKIGEKAFGGCSSGMTIIVKGFTQEWDDGPSETWPIAVNWLFGSHYTHNYNIIWKEKEFITVNELTLCIIDKKNEYEVYACDKNFNGNVSIPSEHNGIPVTKIAPNAFAECKSLTGVSIPESIKLIKYAAFKDSSFFENAEKNSLIYADNWVIGYNGKFEKLNFKPNTVGIAEYALNECNTLTEVVIPKTLLYICSLAFYNCKNIKSVTVEDGNTAFKSAGYKLVRISDGEVFIKCLTNLYKQKKLDGEALVFSNFNFKLAIIQVLMYEKKLLTPEFDAREFADQYTKREIDVDEVTYKPIKEIKKYFQDLQIEKKLASEITELDFEAGNRIYGEVAPSWDGEDDLFTVKKIDEDELKQFTNLKNAGGNLLNCNKGLMELFKKYDIEVNE